MAYDALYSSSRQTPQITQPPVVPVVTTPTSATPPMAATTAESVAGIYGFIDMKCLKAIRDVLANSNNPDDTDLAKWMTINYLHNPPTLTEPGRMIESSEAFYMLLDGYLRARGPTDWTVKKWPFFNANYSKELSQQEVKDRAGAEVVNGMLERVNKAGERESIGLALTPGPDERAATTSNRPPPSSPTTKKAKIPAINRLRGQVVPHTPQVPAGADLSDMDFAPSPDYSNPPVDSPHLAASAEPVTSNLDRLPKQMSSQNKNKRKSDTPGSLQNKRRNSKKQEKVTRSPSPEPAFADLISQHLDKDAGKTSINGVPSAPARRVDSMTISRDDAKKPTFERNSSGRFVSAKSAKSAQMTPPVSARGGRGGRGGRSSRGGRASNGPHESVGMLSETSNEPIADAPVTTMKASSSPEKMVTEEESPKRKEKPGDSFVADKMELVDGEASAHITNSMLPLKAGTPAPAADTIMEQFANSLNSPGSKSNLTINPPPTGTGIAAPVANTYPAARNESASTASTNSATRNNSASTPMTAPSNITTPAAGPADGTVTFIARITLSTGVTEIPLSADMFTGDVDLLRRYAEWKQQESGMDLTFEQFGKIFGFAKGA